ncbi:HalX domain-containing protein [Haloplanus vescus]|uniref:HalX domain-containing protein n=1 Tax=Haloplanus vescus TaxID=555874 RepID=A0A1H3VN09_9EURY|nr:response regulator [Haloplanus vescus]SDZ76193.1 HalX domain-containing protein [Haloplanus vescus]
MDQTQHSDSPTILVVEDDRDLADTYRLWLEPEYEVRTAYTGADGLAWYDQSVDVVLLDRRIPDLSGIEVLRTMSKRDIDDQKAMLTAVEPGRELADLPCDEYVTKPVSEATVRETVQELQIRSQLDDDLQRHFALTSKIVALEQSDADGSNEALTELRRDATQIRARIDDRFSDLDDFDSAFLTLQQ